SLWRALQLLQQRAVGLGLTSAASVHARSALGVAEAADDAYRQSLSLATLALLSAREGSQDTADQALARAKRSAATVDDPLLSVRVRNIEAAIADLRGDRATTLRLTEESLAIAERANATRVSAQLMVNLTDLYAKQRRPADALHSADRALPIVRSFHDARSERALINNAGLAKIGLGRVAEGKQDMARVLELAQRDASLADQAQTLAEFGEALAAVGEARDALALYRRERALTVEFMQRDRAAALREIQARYHTEAEQRSISLRARDNALKDATLANRDLQQRIWMLLAAVLALAVTLAALLYRRVRETHRQLEASQARLRLQSQRDPLTNLANRSHFHSMIDELSARRGAHFEGTLLMVDIDHFKAVNDGHGHAAGDEVLVEMARRLNDAVRDSDMVVRWGGEEFLIVSLQVTAEQAHRMAERMLASIAGTPMIADGQALRITASIGYGRFPLPPHHVGATWEQAVNLVDMALYTAKNQGRNRAMGIVNASAVDAAALHAIEADFEQARSDGRVVLQQTLGP
ncbi:MAG TPA: GGDEF domain-containing protein, partial [Albitalea sp.]|nr:GGDEF domain-containing protein [Albitalea sp.]